VSCEPFLGCISLSLESFIGQPVKSGTTPMLEQACDLGQQRVPPLSNGHVEDSLHVLGGSRLAACGVHRSCVERSSPHDELAASVLAVLGAQDWLVLELLDEDQHVELAIDNDPVDREHARTEQ
jgi:hypothetical protein